MYEQDREGLSGLRVMEGEDLGQGNRVRRQQLQQKDWLDQQIQLKQEQERLRKENQEYVTFLIFLEILNLHLACMNSKRHTYMVY
jgi:intracellular septation protein A